MVTVLGVMMAVGLVLASIAASSAGTAHAQASNNTSAATKNMTSGATGGSSNMTNATAGGGNQSAANATNPLAKVPIIGKIFGGK